MQNRHNKHNNFNNSNKSDIEKCIFDKNVKKNFIDMKRYQSCEIKRLIIRKSLFDMKREISMTKTYKTRLSNEDLVITKKQHDQLNSNLFVRKMLICKCEGRNFWRSFCPPQTYFRFERKKTILSQKFKYLNTVVATKDCIIYVLVQIHKLVLTKGK